MLYPLEPVQLSQIQRQGKGRLRGEFYRQFYRAVSGCRRGRWKMHMAPKSIEHQLAEVIGRAKADGRDEVVDAAALILKFLSERKDKLAQEARAEMHERLKRESPRPSQ